MAQNEDPELTFRAALDKPDLRTANAIASAARKLGLAVTLVTARGLLISGRKSSIEKSLGARIDLGNNAPRFVVEPKFRCIAASATYRAYFPSQPTYFKED